MPTYKSRLESCLRRRLKPEELEDQNLYWLPYGKSPDRYYRRRDSPDGFNRHCKGCCALSRRRSYLKSRPRMLAYQHDYYLAHARELAAASKAYRQRHRPGSPTIFAPTAAGTKTSCSNTAPNIARPRGHNRLATSLLSFSVMRANRAAMITKLRRYAAAFWKRIQDLWLNLQRGLHRTSSPLFLTEFDLPTGWNFPRDFKAKEWTGLLVCQVIGPETANARLLAWWNSPEAFNAPHFQAALGLASPVFQGVMVRRKSNIDQLWKKPGWIFTAFLGLVAILSNLNTLANLLFLAWASPDTVLLLPQEPATIVVSEAKQLVIEANNRTHGDCEVTLNVPVIVPSQGLEIQENTQLGQKLTQGALIQINYNLYPRKTGKYQITFSGTQRAGLLRGSHAVPALECNIEVWPALDANPSVDYKWPTPNGGAVFMVTARHGHPPASLVQYQAVLKGADLSFTGVSHGMITQNSHSGGVAVLIWQAEAKSSPVPQQFEVAVNARTNKDENYWRKLTSELRVNAQSLEKQ